MFKKICAVMATCAILAGCSATPLTHEQVVLQQQQEISRSSCYDRLKTRDIELTKAIAQVPKDQIALVLVLTQMQESNRQMLAMATGKNADPCAVGTNAFDVQIAEVRAKNHALESVTGNVFEFGKWGLGAWAVGKAVDGMGDHIGGDYNNNTVSGKGNTINNNSFKTASDNNMRDDNTISGGDVNKDTSCPDGSCEEGEGDGEGEAGTAGTEGEASTGLIQCIQNPHAGYRPSDSMPLYKPSCSCKSHFAGKC
jgi:hypothetical protein